ncbi:copper amine oxidase N-terminal domain-containing protein [Desertibacillus haloalkaliphilus]|uniref:copper amine oxidase N-terminal domain-containing protein n=1 Tax=Desertibacillus haloalkaliphilus TaxID=1328930 RepID=UPI001C26B717|nr:copper amine oxidase N-terminal domain-containing protein [Desertibacillus haloalkaliphilus]MBU8905963.1 copper amine oxidase N-terminal domain-containing protein [Desertibacillus haloalkaliphilus]
MMKRILTMLAFALILSIAPVQADASSPITVFVDGEKLEFTNDPLLENNRTIVEFRPIFEALGMSVGWEQATQKVTGEMPGTNITLTINQTTAYVNGDAQQLDVPAQILQGRTLVPLRFISEATGADVSWNQQTQTVTIETVISEEEDEGLAPEVIDIW